MPPPLAFYIQCRMLVGLRNAATALRETVRSFSGANSMNLRTPALNRGAKGSFEIATKIAYRNRGPIGIPKDGDMPSAGA
ncbi:MAG TPA: hypothetical protein VI585_05575 [Candidatus Binatia bacterium]